MDIKVRFKLSNGQEELRFSSVSDISDPQVRHSLTTQFVTWSQSFRELALRSLIAAKSSDEIARTAVISFLPKPTSTENTNS